jgi:hypothetical protein
MADTIEKRLSDLEFIIGRLPEDLDARFAGVDTKLAELRELILLQGTRHTKLEARLNEFILKVEARFGQIDAQFADVNTKLDLILQRLPPA